MCPLLRRPTRGGEPHSQARASGLVRTAPPGAAAACLQCGSAATTAQSHACSPLAACGCPRSQLWPGRFPCMLWPSSTPGKPPLASGGKQAALEHSLALLQRGGMPRVPWIDALSAHEVASRCDAQAAAQARDAARGAAAPSMHLVVDLPAFPHAVLYLQPAAAAHTAGAAAAGGGAPAAAAAAAAAALPSSAGRGGGGGGGGGAGGVGAAGGGGAEPQPWSVVGMDVLSMPSANTAAAAAAANSALAGLVCLMDPEVRLSCCARVPLTHPRS